jgi:hypothetical protein
VFPEEDSIVSKCPDCPGNCECSPNTFTVTLDEMAWVNSHTFNSTMAPITSVADLLDGGFKVEDTFDFVADFTLNYADSYVGSYEVPMPSFTLRPTSQVEMRLMEQLVELASSREAMADRDHSVWPDRLETTLNAMKEYVGDNVLPFLPPEPE